MKKVLSNEIKKHSLYWQSSGKGQALVLLHGWGMNGAVWQQTVAQLSEYFCVHVVDLPGFGHSNMTSFSSIEDLAKQVLEMPLVRPSGLVGRSEGSLLPISL